MSEFLKIGFLSSRLKYKSVKHSKREDGQYLTKWDSEPLSIKVFYKFVRYICQCVMFALCHSLINMYEITFQVECQTESASLDYCWTDIMAPQT